jgi:hypothetical protein
VAVDVQAPEFAEAARTGARGDDVQLVVVAVEPGQRVRQTQRVTGRIVPVPGSGGAMVAGRYVLFTRLDLPPGQYQLRIGVHSAAAGRAASVYHDLTVPAFDDQPLSLSGLAIERSASADPPVPIVRAETIAALVPFVPVLTRDFTARDEASVFARIYRTPAAGEGPVAVTTTIASVETGRTVWTTTEERWPAAFDLHGEATYRMPLPTGELPAGVYRLRIDASANGVRHAGGELEFSVGARPREPAPRTLPPLAGPPPSSSAASLPDADSMLRIVVERAVRYASEYLTELSGMVAEEIYEQSIVSAGRRDSNRQRRHLRSDWLLVRLPGHRDLTPFRDVFEVDGKAVRDRDDRLRRLFLEPTDDSAPAARRILAEGMRYNIGRVTRNINQPMLPLLFLLSGNAERFELSLAGDETIEGVRARRLDYRETGRPTFIQDGSGGDVVASGSFWIDPATGRVVRTALRISHAFSKMEIEVAYRPLEGTGFWAPARMRESYRSPGERIYCTATYTNMRRFGVDTAEIYRIRPDIR